MSLKWQRSKAWDDEYIPSWAWPIRFILRAFSSITLAVILLVFVSLYATLASVPIGLLAQIPTWIIYAGTLIVPMVLAIIIIAVVLNKLISKRGLRFAAGFFGIMLTGLIVSWTWSSFVWPALRYEPTTGSGFQLWPAFVAAQSGTTLRRLPGFEMTELQFYSWWPMRIALILFVLNMFVATVRRIEFTFKNIGVLTVHTGIITIALGSVYYQKLKKEGDTIVIAGFDANTNTPSVGPPQNYFYDNTQVVLYTSQDRTGMGAPIWEQRPIDGLPRYNDYSIDIGDAHATDSTWRRASGPLPWEGIPQRSIDIPLEPTMGLLDDDITLRAVGYATYAELKEDMLRVEPSEATGAIVPLRIVSLYMRTPDEHGHILDTPAFEFTLMPSIPARRVSENQAFSVEYTLAMDPSRWANLTEQVAPDTEHALVISVPNQTPGASPTRLVVPAQVGSTFTVGDTGFVVSVEQLSPTPPMPIITKGYEGSSSSVAVVRITKPDGNGYQRWVYSRFSELNQDLLDATGATGRPIRRDADNEITVDYLDLSKLQIVIDEQTDGTLRALVRQHGGDLRVIDRLADDERIVDVVEKIDIAVTERWDNVVPFERPVPVPAIEQDGNAVGTHQHAAVAVEVKATVRGQPWKRVIWVPFSRYMGLGSQNERTMRLPDGRDIKFAFGRRQHRFPGFQVQLLDFEMIAYDHRGAPRDYQSILRVSPNAMPGQDTLEFELFDHVCKLNAPLRAPFHWDYAAAWVTNFVQRLGAGINPNQYKLSQSGWDQQGWARSQQAVEQGQLERPFVNFTILGVGNNPGIHIIALGGILMGVGIPWAFYIKPLLVKRESRKLKQQHASKASTQATPKEVVA